MGEEALRFWQRNHKPSVGKGYNFFQEGEIYQKFDYWELLKDMLWIKLALKYHAA